MVIFWGYGLLLVKIWSYVMCSNIILIVLFVLRYYRYVWLMLNILFVCKWKYENKFINYWNVLNSYKKLLIKFYLYWLGIGFF